MISVSVFKDFVKKEEDISLNQILEDIRDGKYRNQVEEIRKAFKNGERELAQYLKKKLPAFTVTGIFENGRKEGDLTTYNSLVILDLDKIVPFVLDHVFTKIKNIPCTYGAFKSPSGLGYKIIVRVSSKLEHHKEAYNQVVAHYKELLEEEIDTSGSDIARLCFMSYDPNCFINVHSEVFEVISIRKEKFYNPPYADDEIKAKSNEIEKYVKLIEERQIDITENYEKWIKLGFALSNELGEFGRAFFHRISKFYEDYDIGECEKQYTKCLKSNGEGITIATFYFIAREAGVIPKKSEEENATNQELEVPVFPKEIYSNLPIFIQDVIAYSETAREKDIMVLGALTVISACLPNIYGIYDESKVFANLYYFLTALPSSGKGKLVFCKRLVNPIHKELREEAELLKQEYEKDLAEWSESKGGMPKPPKPPEKMLFIPANNSSTGAFQLISDNNGDGLIFETEAETLANTFKTDYGNYSEGFRKAFHHETISYYRRTDREYVDIENPKLSALLSGTPKQVHVLIPNAENGLFSRFMFYYLDITPKWKNVFSKERSKGLEDYFDNLGERFYELYKSLKDIPEIRFSYSIGQIKEFHDFFTKLNLYYLNVSQLEYIATVRRLGIIAFRISMIMTTLRIMETGDVSEELICSEEDFSNTLEIIKVLVKHSSKVYSSLPIDKSPINYKNNKEQFLNNLPHKFTTQDYSKIAMNLSISVKTAEGYITDFCKTGLIIRKSQGNYINPSKQE